MVVDAIDGFVVVYLGYATVAIGIAEAQDFEPSISAASAVHLLDIAHGVCMYALSSGRACRVFEVENTDGLCSRAYFSSG